MLHLVEQELGNAHLRLLCREDHIPLICIVELPAQNGDNAPGDTGVLQHRLKIVHRNCTDVDRRQTDRRVRIQASVQKQAFPDSLPAGKDADDHLASIGAAYAELHLSAAQDPDVTDRLSGPKQIAALSFVEMPSPVCDQFPLFLRNPGKDCHLPRALPAVDACSLLILRCAHQIHSSKSTTRHAVS